MWSYLVRVVNSNFRLRMLGGEPCSTSKKWNGNISIEV